MELKYKSWVKVDGDSRWYTNAMEYATDEDAQEAGRDLMSRWLLTVDRTTAPVGTDPNDR